MDAFLLKYKALVDAIQKTNSEIKIFVMGFPPRQEEETDTNSRIEGMNCMLENLCSIKRELMVFCSLSKTLARMKKQKLSIYQPENEFGNLFLVRVAGLLRSHLTRFFRTFITS